MTVNQDRHSLHERLNGLVGSVERRFLDAFRAACATGDQKQVFAIDTMPAPISAEQDEKSHGKIAKFLKELRQRVSSQTPILGNTRIQSAQMA